MYFPLSLKFKDRHHRIICVESLQFSKGVRFFLFSFLKEEIVGIGKQESIVRMRNASIRVKCAAGNGKTQPEQPFRGDREIQVKAQQRTIKAQHVNTRRRTLRSAQL